MKSSGRGAGIVGAYEIPERALPDMPLIEVFSMAARGALADAGLHARQVDGLFMANLPGLVPALTLAEYMGIEPRWSDTTRIGGTAFLAHVHHAVLAIEAGACSVALVVYGSLSRSGRVGIGTGGVMDEIADERETLHGATIAARYALFASRHMHEFGTTPEQLAAPAVAASEWGARNPQAFKRGTLSVDEVLSSAMIANPLTAGMCCVITDGGGAVVVARGDIARDCRAGAVRILGTGESLTHRDTSSALRFRRRRVPGLRPHATRRRLLHAVRFFHDHGHHAARRTGLLRQGRRRSIRRFRGVASRRRVANQHGWRRIAQQPPRHARHLPHRRSREAVARRSRRTPGA